MLKSRLLDPASAVLLYGTTPPRAGTAEDGVRLAAEKLAARLAGLPLDGVVVYDIQDETGRSAAARPFPTRDEHELQVGNRVTRADAKAVVAFTVASGLR